MDSSNLNNPIPGEGFQEFCQKLSPESFMKLAQTSWDVAVKVAKYRDTPQFKEYWTKRHNEVANQINAILVTTPMGCTSLEELSQDYLEVIGTTLEDHANSLWYDSVLDMVQHMQEAINVSLDEDSEAFVSVVWHEANRHLAPPAPAA